MVRDKKRSRSLFELMDPKGVYRTPAGAEEPDRSEPPEPPKEEEAAVEPVQEDSPADEVKPECEIESFLAVDEGRIRLTMNYHLAIMLCFAAVVLVICALLIGWRLGRDSAAKTFLNNTKDRQETIEQLVPGIGLKARSDKQEQ